ncbi:MAG: uroporphyrinogen decarboxylase family protein [Eubacteriales bacterium]
MTNNVEQLQQERKQIFNDFYSNKIPKRMPITYPVPRHLIAEYGKQNLIDFQFDYNKLAEPARELLNEIYSDTCPIFPMGFVSRPPKYYQFLDSQSFVIGQGGFVQHPEVSGMKQEEYPELIEEPYAFLLEKVIPRQCHALDTSDPVNMMLSALRAKTDLHNELMQSLPLATEIKNEFGYYPGAPLGSMGFTEAPYDFIADQLRGFSGMSMDIRRHRSEIKEACEAVLPLLFYVGLPSNPHPEGQVGIPLHMPTFMREKDFDEIWLPSFKTMIEQYAARGSRMNVFCEDDWMRYLDYLYELPAGTVLKFEYGDPQKIKDKLGKKFLIAGLYPISLVKSGTKQQVIDKAKELLDIMMPGGGYIFSFDKAPLTLSDINLENYIALSQFLKDYAVYPNAGEAFGTPLNSEGFKVDESLIPKPKSKYLFNWDEYKKKYPLTPDYARADLEKVDQEVFSYFMNLLL